MLIHGTGFRDYKYINYWGRIPEALEKHGASVFYGLQDSWGAVDKNAQTIRENANKVLKENNCSKINLIAHSKGGLDARYLISTLGMSDQIASLTTIATPHHGSKTMDTFCRFPVPVYRIAAIFVNLWFRILGDKHPDFFNSSRGFSTTEMKKFNTQNPDVDGVFYQSYGAVMHNSLSDLFMALSHFIIKRIEGENDGLVTVASARWTNFQGILRGASSRGISHCDVIDLRRKRLTKKEKTGCISDITLKYIGIVTGLKDMGL
jgi:triacylglycerol lipase